MASMVECAVIRADEKEKMVMEREEEGGVCSDQELDELLDFSLGEFGKHMPSATSSAPAPSQPPSLEIGQSKDGNRVSGEGGEGGEGGVRGEGGGQDEQNASTMQEFEDVFSEEFVAQAQAKLEEAMQVLSKEDPELWRQLKSFSDTATGGLCPGGREGEEEAEAEKVKEGGGGSIEETLEETLRKLKESTEKIEAEGGLGDDVDDLSATLLKMMEEMKAEGEEGGGGGGDWGEEDSEETLVNMMDKFMGSFLFSKDVLYPFLTHTCKQYEDWLPGQREKLSSEDYTRYSKQLEVMREMCHEFEAQGGSEEDGEEGKSVGGTKGGGGEGGRQEEEKPNQKITELMHQLQQYGHPPADVMGDQNTMPPPLLPGVPPTLPSDCCLM